MKAILLRAALMLSATVLSAQPAALDESFNVGAGFTSGGNRGVIHMNVTADGKIIAIGNFAMYNGSRRGFFARLNNDGSLDASWTPVTQHVWVNSLISPLPADGSIIVAGNYSNTDDIMYATRILADGTVDSSFFTGTGFDSSGGGVILSQQPDGKIIAGGTYSSYSGNSARRICRLNSDGTFDASFNAGTGFVGYGVDALIMLPDGKMIVLGEFSEYNGRPVSNIIRLNADGSADTTYRTGSGFDQYTGASVLQPDGKVVISGTFTSYDGNPVPHIARLNADGTLDKTFNVKIGPNNTIRAMTVQPNGKIVIVGHFTSFEAKRRIRIARLNADGTLDMSFDPQVGFTGFLQMVASVAVQSDGRILAGGWFDAYNQVPRSCIARLNGDAIASVTAESTAPKMIAPNPVTSTFFVSSPARIDRITVSNVLGQVVETQQPSAHDASVDLSQHPNGIYLVNVASGSSSRTETIIKQ